MLGLNDKAWRVWLLVYFTLIIAVETTEAALTNGNTIAILVAGFGIVLGATWGRIR